MARRRGGWFGLSLCGLALFAGGCGQSAKPLAPAKSLIVLHQGKPVSDEEANAFGDELAAAIIAGDAETLKQQFDLEAMTDMVTSGLELPPQEVAGFSQGLKNGLIQNLASNLAKDEDGEPPRISTLRVREKDGVRWALLRLLVSDGAVKYIEVALVRRQGKIRAVDVFDIAMAERISQTARQLLIQLAAQRNRGLLSRLSGQEHDFLKHSAEIKQLMTARREKRWHDVLASYQRLPESLQNHKVFLLYRIEAAQGILDEDNKPFLDAIADFRAHFPDEAGVDLLAIDECLLRMQYAEAIACIDRLEKFLGGDPYLDVMRSNIQLAAGDAAAARASAARARQAEPDLPDALLSLIAASLTENAFDDVLAQLRALRDEFGEELTDLESDENFAEFIKSPQYQQWLMD